MPRHAFWLVVLLFAIPALASDIHQRVADNGLAILTRADHAAPVAHVCVYVQTGSMTEGRWMGYGISHLTEHLVAGGSTATRTEEESLRLVESIGNQMNAYTTKDHTAYFLTVPAEHTDTAIDLLSDWLTRAAITEAEYERERGVVTREIEKGLSETGRVKYDLMNRTMFTVHPVRHPTIGYLEVFENTTRDDVLQYYRTRYVPNNMVAVAVGDFDAVAVADRIAAAFAHAVRSDLQPDVFPEEPAQLGPRFAKKGMDVDAAYVTISYRTVPLAHPDLYPLDVLSFVLSNGDSSRLVRKVRDELGLVTSISSYSHTPRHDTGVFAVDMELRPESIDAATAAVLAELETVMAQKVKPEELRTAKRKKQADLVFGNQTVEAQASSLGSGYLSAGNPDFDTLYVETIQQVKADDVLAAARRYLRTENRTITVIVPNAQIAAATASRATREAKLAPTLHTLDNGLRVVHLVNPSVPLVHVTAVMEGGVAYETQETAGIANLVARMLSRGAGRWDAQEIARFFDGIGGGCDGSAGYNSLSLSMNVLADDFEAAMPYFAAQLAQPTFPADELEKIREQTLATIARLDDDWTTEAMRLFRRHFYAKSPYENTVVGTAEAVAALTRDDLAAYHARMVHPKNTVLAVFGDVSWERVQQALSVRLGGWQGSPEFALPELPAVSLPNEEQIVRKTTEKPIAGIYMGYPGMTIADKQDRVAMTVLDGILSGIYYPGGWLHKELRGQQLVYVVHAFNVPGLLPGFFGIYAGTQPEKADEVVSRIRANIARLCDEPVSEDELKQAQDMAVAAEALTTQTNAELAQRAALDELYGLGYAWSDGFAERIRAISREDVLAVARKYLTAPTVAIASPEPAEAAMTAEEP